MFAFIRRNLGDCKVGKVSSQCIHGKSLSGIYISVKDPKENKPPETRYYRKEQCTTTLFITLYYSYPVHYSWANRHWQSHV